MAGNPRNPESHEIEDQLMSGETAQAESGWTTDTVHSQIMTLLDERDKRHTLALEAATSALLARLDAIDKATDKFEAHIEKVPTDVDKQVGHLKELTKETFRTVDERFTGVALQFKERDTRSERESRDNKVAVDAAFAAQKEAASEQNKSNTLAIDKSEKATAETLNKQADLFKSTTDALDDKIVGNKDTLNKMDTRLTAIESRGVVVREAQVQNNWGTGTLIAIIATLISLAGLVVVLIKVG
jgi:HSP90 family molecular chaperone